MRMTRKTTPNDDTDIKRHKTIIYLIELIRIMLTHAAWGDEGRWERDDTEKILRIKNSHRTVM